MDIFNENCRIHTLFFGYCASRWTTPRWLHAWAVRSFALDWVRNFLSHSALRWRFIFQRLTEVYSVSRQCMGGVGRQGETGYLFCVCYLCRKIEATCTEFSIKSKKNEKKKENRQAERKETIQTNENRVKLEYGNRSASAQTDGTQNYCWIFKRKIILFDTHECECTMHQTPRGSTETNKFNKVFPFCARIVLLFYIAFGFASPLRWSPSFYHVYSWTGARSHSIAIFFILIKLNFALFNRVAFTNGKYYFQWIFCPTNALRITGFLLSLNVA